jgi:hypothetical protein
MDNYKISQYDWPKLLIAFYSIKMNLEDPCGRSKK